MSLADKEKYIQKRVVFSKDDVKEAVQKRKQRMVEECDEEGKLTVNQCLEIDDEIFGFGEEEE